MPSSRQPVATTAGHATRRCELCTLMLFVQKRPVKTPVVPGLDKTGLKVSALKSSNRCRFSGSSDLCARRTRRSRPTDVAHSTEAVAEALTLRPERAVTKQPRATPWDFVMSSRPSPVRAPQTLSYLGKSLVICDRRNSKSRTERGSRTRKLCRPFRAFICFKSLFPGRRPGLHCDGPVGASVACSARFLRMNLFPPARFSVRSRALRNLEALRRLLRRSPDDPPRSRFGFSPYLLSQ
jgi:hypothetical protein